MEAAANCGLFDMNRLKERLTTTGKLSQFRQQVLSKMNKAISDEAYNKLLAIYKLCRY